MGYVNPKTVCGLVKWSVPMIFKWCLFCVLTLREFSTKLPGSEALAYRRTSLWHADLLLSARDSQH